MSDRWSALDFKAKLAVTRPNVEASIGMVPTWVGDHNRRLLAYLLLDSYLTNTSRKFRSQFFDIDDISEANLIQTFFDPVSRDVGLGTYNDYREYGDADLIRQQTLAALIGETQTVVVPGAAEAREAKELTPENEAALKAENYLRDWFEREMMQLKLIDCENNALGFGDGVYVLGWDSEKHRDRLRVYHPSMYFPVLDPLDDDDFPKRVHIAYAYTFSSEDRDVSQTQTYIRRITYELDPVDGFCYMTDAVWRENATGPAYTGALKHNSATIDRFSLAAALNIRMPRTNTLRRNIPVIHIPNTPSGDEHYGESIITKIAQLLDDIQNTDTDLQRAAATTGTPPIALIGSRLNKKKDDKVTVNPGDIWELEKDGDLKVVDTSKSLDALLQLTDYLQKRLSSNSRLPEALLGKVDPSKAPSGLAIALTFGPLVSLINQLRLVRRYKYGLLFKFVLDAAIAARDAGDTHTSLQELPASTQLLPKLPLLEFGNYLPTDLSETVNNVIRLLDSNAIAVETGLKMLQQAGIPIVSIVDEAKRLRSADFGAAVELFTASGGDVAAVGAFLGLNLTRFVPPTPTPVTSAPSVDNTAPKTGAVS